MTVGKVQAADLAAPRAPEATGAPAHLERIKWVGLALLGVIYCLNYMDRQIVSILMEEIRRDIKLSDTQLGLIGGTFFGVVYSILSLPIAMYADRGRRLRIVAGACFLWSLFTGSTGLAVNFIQLAFARIGVAIGEAGGVAPSLSVIGDYFPPPRRVLAISIYSASSTAGILIGTIGGGVIAAHYGWRMALFIPAILGIIAAPLLLLLVPEPKRVAETSAGLVKPVTLLESLALFIRLPSLRWLLVGIALYSTIGNAIVTWTPAVLMRDLGATVQQVGLYYGPVIGFGLMGGALAGGALVTHFARATLRAYTVVPSITMLLCAPMLILAYKATSWPQLVILVLLPIVLFNCLLPPALSLVQELTPSKMRATASAILLMVLNLVGMGLGPVMIGRMSELLRPTLGESSLRYAMLIALPALAVFCSLALYISSRHVKRDHARVQAEALG